MATIKISRTVERVEEVEMEVSFPVYLKHGDFPRWMVKVSGLEEVLVVDTKELKTQTIGEYFLTKEEFILATEEEFVTRFNEVIESFAMGVSNSIEVNN